MLTKAIAIAATRHEGQRDKGGKPYILHSLRVMNGMMHKTDDEDILCAAVMHDVVEDCDETLDTIRAEGFSDRTIELLHLLTHWDDLSYDEYIKIISTDRDAANIKMEDLKDNSNITRLKGLRKKDFERMERYHRAYVYLSD